MFRLSKAAYSLFAALLCSTATSPKAEQKNAHPELSLANSVVSLACAPGRQFIAAGYRDGVVKVWNPVSKNVYFTERAHPAPTMVALSPDGKLLATASRHEHKLWDLDSGKLKWTYVLAGGYAAHSKRYELKFSPDGKLLASAGGMYGWGEIQLIDVETGSDKGRLNKQTGPVREFTFLGKSNSVLSMGIEKNLKNQLWAVSTWDSETVVRHQWGQPRDRNTTSLCASPDGKTYFLGTREPIGEGHRIDGQYVQDSLSRIVQFDLTTERELKTLWEGNDPSTEIGTDGKRTVKESQYIQARNLKVSANGEYLAARVGAWNDKNNILVIEIKTKRVVASIDNKTGSINVFDFLPDGRHIVTGDETGMLNLWPISQNSTTTGAQP